MPVNLNATLSIIALPQGASQSATICSCEAPRECELNKQPDKSLNQAEMSESIIAGSASPI